MFSGCGSLTFQAASAAHCGDASFCVGYADLEPMGHSSVQFDRLTHWKEIHLYIWICRCIMACYPFAPPTHGDLQPPRAGSASKLYFLSAIVESLIELNCGCTSVTRLATHLTFRTIRMHTRLRNINWNEISLAVRSMRKTPLKTCKRKGY